MTAALTVSATKLAEALGRISRVISSSSNIPALKFVHLEALGGELRLDATDTDIRLGVRIEAEGVLAPILAPVGPFLATIKGRGGDVRLEMVGDRLKVACGRARVTLATLPADSLPMMTAPNAAGVERATVDAEALKTVLSFCEHAICREEARHYLQGIYMDAAEGCCVATDGHRLALRRTSDLGNLPSVILPAKSVKVLLAMLDEGEVEIAGDERLWTFEAAGWRMITKLIDGTYPNYQRVIPEWDEETVIEFDREPFLIELATVATFAGDKTKSIRLEKKGGLVTLSAKADGDEAAAEVECDGADRVLGVNAQYLADCVKHADIRVRMSGDRNGPNRIDVRDGVGTLIVMPLKV